MSKLTKRQQIDALQKCLRTQGIKMRELETRLSTQEKWSEYADEMLTALNHALPDPEYDAKCEAEVADVEASLDRHRERLGLNKPQLKQLDQSVFKEWADCWKFFAIDEDGWAWRYQEKPKIDNGDNRWSPSNTVPLLIGMGYDALNWQNSLIERDTAKELLEVDLSSELTGSDLALELLKNQRYIIASVSDVSDADAIECGNNKLIHKSSEDIFTDDMGGIYFWAVALNNQGEPLTAKEVGI